MSNSLGKTAIPVDNSGAIDGAETPSSPLTTPREEGAEMADPQSIRKSPAFQFYPDTFLSDANVIAMSLQERGAYITLICICWIEGSLPSDTAKLAKLCGTPHTSFRKLWPNIAPCFRASGDQRMVHPRLEKEKKKQREYRRRQSDAANKRWHQHSGNAVALPRQLSPSPSPSPSSDFGQKKQTSARAVDEISERAGRFCNEVYPALYAKYRKGARYVSRPAMDFQEALQLCRTWDDERLVKIATVFLTTDHEFAEKGSRTMAQFRSLASWCDSRLAEAGIA